MVSIPNNLRNKLNRWSKGNYYSNITYPTYNELYTLLFINTAHGERNPCLYIPSGILTESLKLNLNVEGRITLVHRIPLYEHYMTSCRTKKTANSIMSELLDNSHNFLYGIKSDSGIRFFICNCGIFKFEDGGLHPLMTPISKVDIRTKKEIKKLIFVDPTVFTNNDLISKFIIKKAIPFYSDPYNYDYREIRVLNLSDYFKTPRYDVQNPCNKDSIYEKLSFNAEESVINTVQSPF